MIVLRPNNDDDLSSFKKVCDGLVRWLGAWRVLGAWCVLGVLAWCVLGAWRLAWGIPRFLTFTIDILFLPDLPHRESTPSSYKPLPPCIPPSKPK